MAILDAGKIIPNRLPKQRARTLTCRKVTLISLPRAPHRGKPEWVEAESDYGCQRHEDAAVPYVKDGGFCRARYQYHIGLFCLAAALKIMITNDNANKQDHAIFCDSKNTF
jgi:hypothetical protein